MNFSDLLNLIGTNMTVWGIFFMIGLGIWAIALREFDKKVDKKQRRK